MGSTRSSEGRTDNGAYFSLHRQSGPHEGFWFLEFYEVMLG